MEINPITRRAQPGRPGPRRTAGGPDGPNGGPAGQAEGGEAGSGDDTGTGTGMPPGGTAHSAREDAGGLLDGAALQIAGDPAPASGAAAHRGAFLGLRRLLGSLQVRFALLGALFFALILGFGLFTLQLFTGATAQSADMRDVWLPSTQLLGDLNNDSSDYRAAEGDVLIAPDAGERSRHAGIVAELDRATAREIHALQAIPRDATDAALFASFQTSWDHYRILSQRVISLALAGVPAQATLLYRTDSRAAFAAASQALEALTADNQAAGKIAALRSRLAYAAGRSAILGALVVAALLVVLALLAAKRGLFDPLSRLAETMRRLARNTTDLPIEGTARQDEIGEMARAVLVFRANAVTLIESRRGLAEQAEALEQKLAYEQQLTRMQRNFIAMISHEFRTPLAAIDAHAQRLFAMRDRIAAADLGERAGRIRAAVHRMTGLIENLLQSARLLDGYVDLQLQPAPFDMAKLLDEVCAFHRETAPEAVIALQAEPRPMMLTGDRKWLFQAFSNLLSNAIKYSPDAVDVLIEAEQENGITRVRVSDKGLGVPVEDRDKLFTRYFRGGNVSGIVGTGVGLYLAQTIANLHGGGITLEAAGESGATFTVELPNAGV